MDYPAKELAITAWPDDPLRVGDAIENQNFDLVADRYYLELIDAVSAMAQGRQATVKLMGIEYTADDILLEIIESQPAADVLLMFVAGQRACGQKMVDEWCKKRAHELAEEEI